MQPSPRIIHAYRNLFYFLLPTRRATQRIQKKINKILMEHASEILWHGPENEEPCMQSLTAAFLKQSMVPKFLETLNLFHGLIR